MTKTISLKKRYEDEIKAAMFFLVFVTLEVLVQKVLTVVVIIL